MVSIYKPEKDSTSWLVINGKVYTGLKSIEDIEKILPGLKASLKTNTTNKDSTKEEKSGDQSSVKTN